MRTLGLINIPQPPSDETQLVELTDNTAQQGTYNGHAAQSPNTYTFLDDDEPNDATQDNVEDSDAEAEMSEQLVKILAHKKDKPATPSACFSWFYDAVQLISSIVDVVLDILVAIEYYQLGYYNLFYISVGIFILAQVSYAFLFTAIWGRKKTSVHERILLFCCILPFGQLVPVFTWIESFHFDVVDKFMIRMQLEPTERYMSDVEGNNSDTEIFWVFLQRKYQAHAGLLAEAFVESVPQSLLQLSALMISRDIRVSPLNISSILMSTFVIASKGYLISYSIDTATFVFNCACVAADVFAFFATTTWLVFARTASIQDENNPEDVYIRNEFEMLMEWLALLCWCTFALGGLAITCFACYDDHVKTLAISNPYQGPDKLWFDLYVLRLMGWLLAVVPVCIALFGLRFSLIPIVVFKSMLPNQAIHPDFYNNIRKFIHFSRNQYDGAIRKSVVADFVKKAEHRLVASQLDTMLIAAASYPTLHERRVGEWLLDLDRLYAEYTRPLIVVNARPEPEALVDQPEEVVEIEVEEHVLEPARPSACWRATSTCCSKIHRRMIYFRLYRVFYTALNDLFNIFLERAIIVPYFFSDQPQSRMLHSLPTATPRNRTVWASLRGENRTTGCLLVSGISCITICAFFWLFCGPLLFSWLVSGTVFPIFETIKFVSDNSFEEFEFVFSASDDAISPQENFVVPALFTGMYVLLICLLLSLTRTVAKQQTVHLDLVPLHGLNPALYKHYRPVIRFLEANYKNEIHAKEIRKFMYVKFGGDIIYTISEFLDEDDDFTLWGPAGHGLTVLPGR